MHHNDNAAQQKSRRAPAMLLLPAAPRAPVPGQAMFCVASGQGRWPRARTHAGAPCDDEAARGTRMHRRPAGSSAQFSWPCGDRKGCVKLRAIAREPAARARKRHIRPSMMRRPRFNLDPAHRYGGDPTRRQPKRHDKWKRDRKRTHIAGDPRTGPHRRPPPWPGHMLSFFFFFFFLPRNPPPPRVSPNPPANTAAMSRAWGERWRRHRRPNRSSITSDDWNFSRPRVRHDPDQHNAAGLPENPAHC